MTCREYGVTSERVDASALRDLAAATDDLRARVERMERHDDAVEQRLGALEARVAMLESRLDASDRLAPEHARLVHALADTMGDLDLPFDASEVLQAAHSDTRLRAALEALDIRRSSELGALFRSLRDRDGEGLLLRRDGREWRIERGVRV